MAASSDRPPLSALPADSQKLLASSRVLQEESRQRIEDSDFKIGPSYLMREKVFADGGLERVWRTSILPLLEEHHFGDLSTGDVARRYGLAAIRATVSGPSTEADDDQAPGPR